MSTQLDSYKDNEDQDATDELPVLDLSAYEATFPEHPDDTAQFNAAELSKTMALLAAAPPSDAASDPAATSLPVKVRGRDPKGQAKPELTADVELILKRITDLEEQVVGLKGLNDGLQQRCDTLSAERDAQARNLLAVQADHARLVELRTLATEMTARLEDKLRDQASHSAGQIAELQAQRGDENTQAEQVRLELQQQLHESRLQLATLQQDHDLLLAELKSSADLADRRAATIAELENHLSHAESSAAQLARQLAARLMDGDSLVKLLDARNRTIEELRASTESQGANLAAALAAIHDLTERLDTRTQQLSGERARLGQSTVEITDRDGRIAQLCNDIKQATEELHLVSAQRDDLLQTLASHEQAQAAVHTARAEQAEHIVELNDNIRSRDELIENLRNQIQTHQDDESVSAERIAQAQQRVQSLVQLISHKNRKIAALKSDVAVYAAALAAIRGNLTRIDGDDMESAPPQRHMEPVEHDGGCIVLDRKVTTVGRTIENDICLPSKLISRHHARLLVAPSGVIIEDTGSTNGCFVNGRQIRQQLMRDGDILSLGGLRYRLCSNTPNEIHPRGNVIDLKDARSQAVENAVTAG